MTNGPVTLTVLSDLGEVFITVEGETLLTLTAEAAMRLADDLTRAAEPSLLLKAVA